MSFTDIEIAKIDGIIRKAAGNFPDTIQSVWVKILDTGITNHEQIRVIARKMSKQDGTRKYHENMRTVSLDKPIESHQPNSGSGERTLLDTLRSPEEENENDWETRSEHQGTGKSQYGYLTPIDNLIESSHKPICKFCSSVKVVKNGTRTKSNQAQYWLCRTCGRGFTINGSLPHMRYPKYVVVKAVQMRKEGLTLMQIKNKLRGFFKVNVSDTAILNWCSRMNIHPPEDNKYQRRTILTLLRALQSLEKGKKYNSREILNTCEYSPRTKIECTQVFKQELVERNEGYWRISDSVERQIKKIEEAQRRKDRKVGELSDNAPGKNQARL